MTKYSVAGVALIVAWPLANTPALTQEAAGPKSGMSRSAACRADCSTDGLHGFYRTRTMELSPPTSTDWGKIYSECVQTCLAPLPPVYIQRSILESGGLWFGKSAASCLDCHASGPNLRVPQSAPNPFATGSITPVPPVAEKGLE